MRSFFPLAVAVLALGCEQKKYDTEREQQQAFLEEVIPVFEKDCGSSSCHSATDDKFAALNPEYFAFPVDADGKITGAERVEKALERARHKLSGAGGRFATLLRKPLDESLGGLQHRGGSQYRSVKDPNYETLLAWAEKARPDHDEPVGKMPAVFAEKIQPVLAKNRCFQSNCHGGGASNFLILDPGVEGEFDARAIEFNYGQFVQFLNLESPDPMQSRLVRKTIPAEEGGIFHRGGNAFFFPSLDDVDLKILTGFVSELRAELQVEETGVVTGLVFAAAPPTPRKVFDLSAWQPGGDVYSLVPAQPGGTVTNLTQAHHSGDADIRDPAVSHDGRKVAFAMRKSQTDCLNLYVMNVDGSGLTQLTNDTGTLANGIKVSNVEPLWGPDDKLYFVSTAAGALAESGYPQSNLWRINADGTAKVRLSQVPDNEAAPYWRFYHGHGATPELRTLDLTFTAMRGVGMKRQGPLMRVPPDLRADYHPHFGVQNPNYQMFTQGSRFNDDREVLVLMDEANLWEGGALGLIDRNLGPTIVDQGAPAVVNYVDSLQKLGFLGEETSHKGYSKSGFYRDPYAMPDGTVVVSHSPRALTLSDPAAAPDTALYRLTVAEAPRNVAYVKDREVLVDLVGKVESDPSPIMVRRREEVLSPKKWLKYGTDTGELLNFDLAVGLTVARQDSPSNTKPIEQVAFENKFVRLVEEIPLAPADYPGWPDTRINKVGRGRHGMRRVLAEFPATHDRSFYVTLPAAVPFFVQSLDFSRLTNTAFNQWLFLQPGEKLKQVTPRTVYNHRCGGCHGAIDGDLAKTVGRPDGITEASRVAANYDVATASDLPPKPFGLEPADRLEVDFERDVQPIFTQSCATAGCHVSGAQAPNLAKRTGAAGFSGSYEALTAAGTASQNGFSYVDPDSSEGRTSYLAEVLLGRELVAPRVYDSQGCPAPTRINLMDLETILRWLDLGASYRGIGPKTKPPLPELAP
jgi:hypothetical protein